MTNEFPPNFQTIYSCLDLSNVKVSQILNLTKLLKYWLMIHCLSWQHLYSASIYMTIYLVFPIFTNVCNLSIHLSFENISCLNPGKVDNPPPSCLYSKLVRTEAASQPACLLYLSPSLSLSSKLTLSIYATFILTFVQIQSNLFKEQEPSS